MKHMKLPTKQQGITPIAIDQFRESGMMMLANMFLQPFGMALVVKVEDGKVIDFFPARTTFRGFDPEDEDEMHERLAKYLADNAADFPEEIK